MMVRRRCAPSPTQSRSLLRHLRQVRGRRPLHLLRLLVADVGGGGGAGMPLLATSPCWGPATVPPRRRPAAPVSRFTPAWGREPIRRLRRVLPLHWFASVRMSGWRVPRPLLSRLRVRRTALLPRWPLHATTPRRLAPEILSIPRVLGPRRSRLRACPPWRRWLNRPMILMGPRLPLRIGLVGCPTSRPHSSRFPMTGCLRLPRRLGQLSGLLMRS